MTVRTPVIKTTIGEHRRIEISEDLLDRAQARRGSGLMVEVLEDGVIELRVRPERTIEDLQRLYPLTVPIDDLEATLREEEQRLADEFR